MFEFLIFLLPFRGNEGNSSYPGRFFKRPLRKRPNIIGPLLVGLIISGVVGLPTGAFLSFLFPEGSGMRFFLRLGGLAAPPIAMIAYCNKKWVEYVKKMLEHYEAAKEQLRKNPESPQLREAMLQAGREYYSCMRDEGVPTIYDEQAINNDMKAILGR